MPDLSFVGRTRERSPEVRLSPSRRPLSPSVSAARSSFLTTVSRDVGAGQSATSLHHMMGFDDDSGDVRSQDPQVCRRCM